MIPIFKPRHNTTRILTDLEALFDSGWTGLGPKTQQFEDTIASYLKCSYSVFLNSCTSALHLAIECLNLPKPSKIIVPDISFVSTAASVIHAGHIPVLAPVDDTIQIDLDFVETRLHNDTSIRCVMPVHYSGNCCDMDRLTAICKDIHVIEDCAHAMGSTWKGRPLGTFGDMGCFSFHAVKNLPMGDGGLVVGKLRYRDDLRVRGWLGIDKSTYARTGDRYSYSYDVQSLGFKYHGNDIMAVIGLANFALLDECNQRRRQIYDRYQRSMPYRVHAPNPYVVSSHHLVSCEMDHRDAFIDRMGGRGVSIGVHYKPLSSFGYYREYATAEVREKSMKVFKKLATLPCYPDLGDGELDYVVGAAREFAATQTA